ncbi:MAG: class I SAM-dependent methyltransferase [Candidatus Hermodarchaeota archaeon]
MEEYYKRRANEYEEIYYRADKTRQEENRKITDAFKNLLKGRKTLEIACGTGYWTQFLSETAQSIVATDLVPDVLEIAKRKHYRCPVSFLIEDAYNLSFDARTFDGGLANFWFSHIPKRKIDSFLEGFHRVLQCGSRVFMADNVFVPGIGGTLITKKGDEDNTYKLRQLKDKSEHLVLKNYYTVDELLVMFQKYVPGFTQENIFYGTCFWYVMYELKE